MTVDAVAYRRLLRAYPRRWRARRGEELLTVLMQDAADRGRDTPTLGDVFDVLTRGLEARLEIAVRRVPHRLRSRAAALAVVFGSSLSLMLLVLGELPLPFNTGIEPPRELTLGPVMTAGVAVYAGWIAAGAALLLDRQLAARLTATATTLLTVVLVAISALTGVPRPPLYLLAVLFGFGVVASSGRPAAGRSTQALGFSASLLIGAALIRGNPGSGVYDRRLGFYRGEGDLHWVGYFAPWVLGAALIVAAFLSWRGRAWLIPTIVAGFPAIYLSVFATLTGGPSEYLTAGAFLTAAALFVVAIWAVGARSGLRISVDRCPPGGQRTVSP